MLQALSALSCLTPHVLSGSAPLPDVEVAKRDTRAAHIFNSIHSALRQWGSSIQHNGLSFLPVTIPEGNIFYHGTHSTERPAGLEWLAFEMEHANLFAMSFEFHKNDSDSTIHASSGAPEWRSLHGKMSALMSETAQAGQGHGIDAQRVLSSSAPDDDDDGGHKRPGPPEYPPDQRGYFHTYRAARPLNLVYIDGMAAAKCGLGTLDSQDFILNDFDTQRPPGGMQGEIRRRPISASWPKNGMWTAGYGWKLALRSFTAISVKVLDWISSVSMGVPGGMKREAAKRPLAGTGFGLDLLSG